MVGAGQVTPHRRNQVIAALSRSHGKENDMALDQAGRHHITAGRHHITRLRITAPAYRGRPLPVPVRGR
jgi:hypothetical protein